MRLRPARKIQNFGLLLRYALAMLNVLTWLILLTSLIALIELVMLTELILLADTLQCCKLCWWPMLAALISLTDALRH